MYEETYREWSAALKEPMVNSIKKQSEFSIRFELLQLFIGEDQDNEKKALQVYCLSLTWTSKTIIFYFSLWRNIYNSEEMKKLYKK